VGSTQAANSDNPIGCTLNHPCCFYVYKLSIKLDLLSWTISQRRGDDSKTTALPSAISRGGALSNIAIAAKGRVDDKVKIRCPACTQLSITRADAYEGAAVRKWGRPENVRKWHLLIGNPRRFALARGSPTVH